MENGLKSHAKLSSFCRRKQKASYFKNFAICQMSCGVFFHACTPSFEMFNKKICKIHLLTLKRLSVGSKRYVQQYVLLKWPQAPSLETLAFGKTLVKPSGTCPAKPGSTGVIPKARIWSKILCCNCNWFLCHDDGRGPPQPRRFPILALLQTK